VSTSRIDVVAGGRVHTVHLEPGDGPTRVRVRIDDGEAVLIDAAAIGTPNAATTWSLRDIGTGIVSTAAVTIGSSGDGEAVVAGHVVPVALANRRRRARAMLGAGNGDQRVVAPMPGKVVKMLVAIGDTVEPRQGLVVVEAMKMENELTVARAGIVTKIEVSEGASVEAGRLLIVVS
jgi:biotin carboxyl carrier protein